MGENSLFKEKKLLNRFTMAEIVSVATVALTNLVTLVLEFYLNFRNESRVVFSIEMLISIIDEVFLGLAMFLSLYGHLKKNFFVCKWALLTWFLAETVHNAYTLISDLIVNNPFMTDTVILVINLAMDFLIIREMTSLYAPGTTRFMFRFSILLLAIEAAHLTYLTYNLLSSVGKIDSDILVLYVVMLVDYLLTLTLPSVLFLFYPLAINANYDIEDQEVRDEAISGK
jgi:hypothetical protein